MTVSRFFLGANTPSGFFSLYDGLIDPAAARSVYILKGGPGCGKSTLMRRVGRRAEETGLDVEYILCSGDPDSLDGVVLPSLGVALVDGTAPHVIEPSCPGAVDTYIDLGRFYRRDQLRPRKEEILAHMAKNRAAYDQCYRCLGAAGTLEEHTRSLFLSADVKARLSKRAAGILSRELGRDGGARGLVKTRFLSAVTCQGVLTLWETVEALASRIYILEDSFGLAHELLSPIALGAAARGYDVIACPSPMAPDRLEHLILPGPGVAFVTSCGDRPCPLSAYRRLHPDTLVTGSDSYRAARSRIRFSRKVAAALSEEALRSLARAKEAHDALEACYNPAVDFDGVYAQADSLCSLILKGSVTANP